jgi:hypothetical protein
LGIQFLGRSYEFSIACPLAEIRASYRREQIQDFEMQKI